MNTAVADIEPKPLRTPNALVTGFARLDMPRKVMFGLGSLALIVALATAFYLASRPDYRVLFANLSDKDGGAVVAQLAQMNIPYKYSEGGGAILVPADRVHDTRLKLASAGLPKGSTMGFELLDTNRLGMTQFQERLTFQRGLEGELVRTITSLSSVADARVHLALPNQNGFFREQQKPSASVMLTLQPGRSLDRQQVAGIVHLVASSVPEMDPKAVSVVDQNGNLLSQTPDGQGNGADSQQLDYVRTLERQYTQRIVNLLEPVLGRDNVRAQVTADIDFSQTEQTSEQHRPNQNGEPSAVRSQQLIESGGAVNSNTVPGVPAGAVANQPPGPSSAPINNPPGAAANAASGNSNATGGGSESRRESVINYEVDKTVKVTRNATGTVRKLSAAVVLNNRMVKDKKGELVSTPIPPEQMAQIKALVQEAIGYNADRGDSVNVMNAAFTKPVQDNTDVVWWKQADTQDMARSLAWPLGTVLLGLVLFLGLVRPAFKMMKNPSARSPAASEGPQIDALLDEQPQRPGLPTPVQNEVTAEALRLEDAKRLAKDNPVAVANIIKGWVNGEAPSAAST